MRPKKSFISLSIMTAVGGMFGLICASTSVLADEQVDRTNLPLEIHPVGGKIGKTVPTSTMPKINPVQAPKGAPNVVLVMLDDVGFSASSTFGGAIQTPVLDSLKKEGVTYNEFSTTALCAPTRAALLTGRNHHSVGSGNITEYATSFPGYDSIIPKTTATIAEVLKGNGYSTGAFGKWHNTPVWEISPSGPFDRWPTGEGFEEFYGFMGGEAHQYFPGLYHGTTPVERPAEAKKYYLTDDLVKHALTWAGSQHAVTPKKPFFMYFVPGATHAPHHVYPEWIKPYKGKFNQGWDKLREETFARQKKLGIIPANTKLTPRDSSIPAWDTLSPDRKKIASRLMETYAGFLAQTDYQIGQLEKGIKDMGVWDNTVFIYIVGDNGGAPAGGLKGVFNEMSFLNGVPESDKVILSKLDQIGGPKASNEYPVGYSWAMGTPFKFTKQWASHFGGTRNPLIISWPKHMKDNQIMRTQFHHVVDIYPTILEAAKIPVPKEVNGFKQRPLDGVSMLYTLENPKAPSRHHTQYFEIMGTRAIYHDGWIASSSHGRGYDKTKAKKVAFDQDKWELYDMSKDFSQYNDVSKQYPEKLKEMVALFDKEAKKNNVYPLDDRGPQRAIGARPSILGKRTEFTLRGGDVRLPEDMIRSTFNRSYTIDAKLNIPKSGGTEGVITAAGGYFAGLSLFIKDNKPMFTYNYFGSKYTTLAGEKALPTGEVNIRYEFEYAGKPKQFGKGGDAKLFVNDKQVAEAHIDNTVPLGFTADETLDVGEDTGTPSSDKYEGLFPIKNAEIERVHFTLR